MKGLGGQLPGLFVDVVGRGEDAIPVIIGARVKEHLRSAR